MPRPLNTAGPNRAHMHDTLSALARMPEAHRLVLDRAFRPSDMDDDTRLK